MRRKLRNGKKCLRPDCPKSVQARGLCRTCYNSAKHGVKRGFATWEKLEQEGKVLPRRRGGDPAAYRWLFDFSQDPALNPLKMEGAPPAPRTRKKRVGWPKGRKRGPYGPRKIPLVTRDEDQPIASHPFERTQ